MSTTNYFCELLLRPLALLVWVVMAASVMMVVLASAAQAATITVNSLADTATNDGECTLREASAAANTNTASGAAAGECAAGQAKRPSRKESADG